MQATTKTSVKCYHCGDDCDDEPILFDDKHFCCHGCQAVYELIEQSDLHQYYQNADLKARKVEDQLAIERKYGFLEQEEVVTSLLRYHDEDKSIVRFYLPGIHCSSCIYLLEHLPKLDHRILRAEVNFIRKEINVSFSDEMSLREVAVMLGVLGYPPSINLDSIEEGKNVKKGSGIGLKIAVAGFCFGNSMLISLPEYLDSGFQLEETFKSLFGWINLILMMPVAIYAAQDYYKSAWTGLQHRYLNIDVPITLGILTLFLRSIYEILWGIGPGYVDSLNGLVFFLLVGKWYQGKSYQALSFERDYKSYFPVSVVRILNGREENVMIKDLKPGDEIVLHNQELIPADGIITGGKARIDYSFVTGEADPVSKHVGERVFAGGRQSGGELTIQLEKAVNNSELTQLWNSDGFSKKDRNKYDSLIDRVSKYFTIVVLLLAVGTGVYWSYADASKVWDAVAAVLIVACPCALALALPFALGHGMRILGNIGVYLKNAQVIEQIAKIQSIVFDKTGTLTKNDPVNVRFEGKPLTTIYKSIIKTGCANSAHPLSKLIAGQFGDDVKKLPLEDFSEEIGKGYVADISGHKIKAGSASFLGVASENQLQESRVHVSIDDAYIGCFKIAATYRDGIFEELELLRGSHQLHLLSGDNSTEKERLAPYFDQLAFDQKPKQKLEYIQQLSERTLMIGDGLNDAGALKSADVGFAVCEDIHQFSPACDALLEADAVKAIPTIFRFSKGVMVVIIAALIISFAYNIVGLSFAVTGNLTPVVSAILMPISSVTVVGFITLAVNLIGRRILGKY